MDKNYLVVKSNYFIMNSSYDLSLEEQKIILTLASMVQPEDEEFKIYKFKINEFINLLGIENQAKYTEVPKLTKELMKKVFEIQEENKIIQLAWLSSAVYEKGTGYVELEFSPKLKPYMLQLKEKFTQYQLANILTMKSKYSPRIYEILKCNEFKKQSFIEINVDELRKLTKTDNIYLRYNDFKRKIIIQAQKELKQKTDLYFDFEEIKTGRKVTSIRFYMHSNKKTKTSKDEITATIEPIEVKQMKGQVDLFDSNFQKVKKLISEPIGNNDIHKLLRVADNDISIIKNAYTAFEVYRKNHDINNVMSVLIKATKEKWTVTHSNKQSGFINFKQRDDWDFDEIEKLERKYLERSLKENKQ